MSWTDRFNNFPMANLIGWCIVCGLWVGWELWGATHARGATFTYLLRNTLPRWSVLIIWLVLGWHFLWWDATWWKAFLRWFGRVG